MSLKKIQSFSAIVYSTNPNFKIEEQNNNSNETVSAAQQKLKILLDKKQRAGKAVTLITGFSGKQNDLNELAKKLKTFCGTGGSIKDGAIIVQGDNREKVYQWFINNGYLQAKKN